MQLKIQKVRDGAILPVRATDGSAGMDLYACLDEPVTIQPGKSVFIPTGLSMELPKGCAGLIYARSGLACKRGLAPANKVGVIDSDYRGEFIVVLYNHGDVEQSVSDGERIAQLVITPVLTPSYLEVEELTDTLRSAGGFGSTGR